MLNRRFAFLPAFILILPALAADEVKFVKPPYATDNDANQRKIDMFFGDWHEAIPRPLHAGLVARDVLTRGDNFAPTQKAAVLQIVNDFVYATLAPEASMPPSQLVREQEVFYILSGRGKMTAGGKTAELRRGIAVLMPAGLEFTMKNTGAEPLTMYVINEPIPRTSSIYRFTPRQDMLVKDEDTIPEVRPNGWGQKVKTLFLAKEGLANLRAVAIVALDPMTMSEPHIHHPGQEEVMTAVEGTSLALLGTQLRPQPPGVAYMLRPDTLRSNINRTNSRVKFFYFASTAGVTNTGVDATPDDPRQTAEIDPLLGPARQVSKDPRVDLRFGDWRESAPRKTHGSLVERDILSRGDPVDPPRKGAILDRVNSFSYATLAPGASITPTRLEKQQELFYILSGRGKMTAGGETAELYRGIAILMPAGLEFGMTNTGSEPLGMYVINEPIPAGFTPNAKMLVRDENSLRIVGDDPGRVGGSTTGHWAHIVKTLFSKKDGLGTLGNVLTVTLDPLTMGEPHVHHPNSRETWTAIEGTSFAFVDTELRLMPPGVAYMIRPDDQMTHSNINVGSTQVKFLFF